MSCSLIWICTSSSRLGCASTRPLQMLRDPLPSSSASAHAPWRRGRRESAGLLLAASRGLRSTSFGFTWNDGILHFAAVDLEVAVADHLARLRAAGAEAHAVDDVVQTALLEHAEQVFAGDALHRAGLLEHVAELRFEQAVIPAGLLLFAKLQAVADDLRLSILAVLAGNEVAASRWRTFRVWQRSPFRNSFMPSRRHSRQTGPIYRAKFSSPVPSF